MAIKAQILYLEKGVTEIHALSKLIASIPHGAISSITPFTGIGQAVGLLVVHDTAFKINDSIPSHNSIGVPINSDIVLFFNADVSFLSPTDIFSSFQATRNGSYIPLPSINSILVQNNTVRFIGIIDGTTGATYNVIFRAGPIGTSLMGLDLSIPISWKT